MSGTTTNGVNTNFTENFFIIKSLTQLQIDIENGNWHHTLPCLIKLLPKIQHSPQASLSSTLFTKCETLIEKETNLKIKLNQIFTFINECESNDLHSTAEKLALLCLKLKGYEAIEIYESSPSQMPDADRVLYPLFVNYYHEDLQKGNWKNPLNSLCTLFNQMAQNSEKNLSKHLFQIAAEPLFSQAINQASKELFQLNDQKIYDVAIVCHQIGMGLIDQEKIAHDCLKNKKYNLAMKLQPLACNEGIRKSAFYSCFLNELVDDIIKGDWDTPFFFLKSIQSAINAPSEKEFIQLLLDAHTIILRYKTNTLTTWRALNSDLESLGKILLQCEPSLQRALSSPLIQFLSRLIKTTPLAPIESIEIAQSCMALGDYSFAEELAEICIAAADFQSAYALITLIASKANYKGRYTPLSLFALLGCNSLLYNYINSKHPIDTLANQIKNDYFSTNKQAFCNEMTKWLHTYPHFPMGPKLTNLNQYGIKQLIDHINLTIANT